MSRAVEDITVLDEANPIEADNSKEASRFGGLEPPAWQSHIACPHPIIKQ